MQPLSTIEAWNACLQESNLRPVLVFKHSTACPISAEAYRQVSRYTDSSGEADPPVYIVKVIEERPVSNQIAEDLGVQHKSPQLILVQNGEAKWTTSHYGVQADAIRSAVVKQ